MNNFAQREFTQMIAASGVKNIRFRDLCYTCGALLFAHGMNPKIVQETLGHSDISMTLDRYSLVTPTMQGDAAQVIGDIIHRDLKDSGKLGRREGPGPAGLGMRGPYTIGGVLREKLPSDRLGKRGVQETIVPPKRVRR